MLDQILELDVLNGEREGGSKNGAGISFAARRRKLETKIEGSLVGEGDKNTGCFQCLANSHRIYNSINGLRVDNVMLSI